MIIKRFINGKPVEETVEKNQPLPSVVPKKAKTTQTPPKPRPIPPSAPQKRGGCGCGR